MTHYSFMRNPLLSSLGACLPPRHMGFVRNYLSNYKPVPQTSNRLHQIMSHFLSVRQTLVQFIINRSEAVNYSLSFTSLPSDWEGLYILFPLKTTTLYPLNYGFDEWQKRIRWSPSPSPPWSIRSRRGSISCYSIYLIPKSTLFFTTKSTGFPEETLWPPNHR